MDQSTDVKDCYKPTNHEQIKKGDVLLKEEFLKLVSFPMGIVKELQVNDQNETTGVLIYKGKTGEVTKRHIKCDNFIISEPRN